MKTLSIPRRLAGFLAGAAVLAGMAAFAPASPASAAECVLGPSIGSVAREAGVSCPDGISGTGSDPAWGGTGGACKYGWNDSLLPVGFMSYLDLGKWVSQQSVLDDGERVTRATAIKNGKIIGSIVIHTFKDKTFVMGVNIYDRDGIRHEFAYFDCMKSPDGAMYVPDSPKTVSAMPVIGTGPVPTTLKAGVETRGALSPLAGGKYLLRLDITNTKTAANFADLAISMPGYSVDSFALMSPSMTCEPLEGLECSLPSVGAGQTVSTWIVLNVDGSADPTIEVAVTSAGYEKVSPSYAEAPRNHRAGVLSFYQLTRS
jgi:hypothetical protein